jgi:hypothetical protein
MMIPVPTTDIVLVVDSIVNLRQVQQVNYWTSKRMPSPSLLFIHVATTNNHYTTVNSYQQSHDHTHLLAERDRDESIDSFKTDDRSLKGTVR